MFIMRQEKKLNSGLRKFYVGHKKGDKKEIGSFKYLHFLRMSCTWERPFGTLKG